MHFFVLKSAPITFCDTQQTQIHRTKSNYRDTPWSVNGEVRRLSSHFRHLATVDSCDGSQSVGMIT